VTVAQTQRWQRHEGPIVDFAEDFEVIDCRSCGFKHVVPLPTPEELETVYRQDYYSVEKPLYIERYREDVDWWNLVYDERYELFERALPPSRRRLLDVGSGPGIFLLRGKNRGWDVVGIEPSSQSAAHSRSMGLKIVEDFFDQRIAALLGAFDVVHMSAMLEHVPDPRTMIETAHGLLDSGGLLCVVVPNDYNPFQIALRETRGYEPWWVAPPHHLNYFDFDSLASLLSSCGFEVMHRTTTFPMDLFLLMGEDYVGNASLGRECHARRKAFESNLKTAGLGEIKRRLYEAMAELRIGREVVLVGRKPAAE